MRWMLLVASLVMVGCGAKDDDTGSSASRCEGCGSAEGCVAYLGGDDPRETWIAVEAACVDSRSDECRGELYDLCEEGWIGVGCSEPVGDLPMTRGAGMPVPGPMLAGPVRDG